MTQTVGTSSSTTPETAPLKEIGGSGTKKEESVKSPSSEIAGPVHTTSLVWSKVWEIHSPPPINSLKGAFIPRIVRRGKRRQIAIEVHKVNPDSEKQSYEECIIRVLDPATKEARLSARKRAQDKLREQRSAGHGSPGRVASADSRDDADEHDDDDDDTSVQMEDGASAFLDSGVNFEFPDNNDRDWKCKYRFPLKAFSIKGTHKTGVVVHIDLPGAKQTRELNFDNHQEAEEFVSVMERELAKTDERAEAKLKVSLDGIVLKPDSESITFLIEIVSGWDLPAGDMYTSDPYVVCMYQQQEIHRTKFISRTLDPVWTLQTGSLFLLKVDPKELFLSDGLKCHVKDYDTYGSHENLGCFTVPPRVLHQAKGERLEYKLQPRPGSEEPVPGYMAVRCRRATDYDINFMEEFDKCEEKNNDKVGIRAAVMGATSASGGASNLKSIMTKRTKIAKDGEHAGKKLYKIRPGPDPRRIEETTWMTREALDKECYKDSQHWIDTGSGSLGRVFVEILHCDELPNLDTGGALGNKTDAFVSLVYEDTCLVTDVIDDTLAPRWMPWMRRAFIFHMFHSSSQLFLGVFDYDISINPADDHDLIGRVSVDLSNLRKDTMYTLKYDIFTTARMTKRVKKGSITLRLRIEIDDDRKLLLSTLEPPPPIYVNVAKRKDFRVVRFTCTGKYDMDKYSMKVINSYIEELLALQHVLFYLEDAAMSLLLWRGTLPLKMFGYECMVPIHSMSAFVTAVYLVERPQLFPSFFFFSIAWIMLATMGYRRSLPDMWSRCKNFLDLAHALVVGESPAPPHSIDPYENQKEAQAFLDKWKKRISDSEEQAAKAYDESVKRQEEYLQEMEEIGEVDTDLSTKGGGVSIDPFKPILFPFQQNLALVCRYVRHVTHVLNWDECYIAFWVTVGCLLLSLICLVIPWFFLIKWSARLIVWSAFGPWMKLVDVYYVSQIKEPSEEERLRKEEEEREQRRQATTLAASEARIKREDAQKLQAMKKHMFGKFMIRVPVLKEDRYCDMPLPESQAVPYTPDPQPLSELAMQEAGYRKTRLPGQHLVGDMIPTLESQGFTEAPIGEPTAHPKLLDKTGPGAVIKSGPESTAGAYAKIGSLVVVAGVVTWFGVPLLSAVAKWALSYLHPSNIVVEEML